jgi:hypothetical protein
MARGVATGAAVRVALLFLAARGERRRVRRDSTFCIS